MIRVEFHFSGRKRNVTKMLMNYPPRKDESVIFMDSEGSEDEYTVTHVATVITPDERFLYVVLN